MSDAPASDQLGEVSGSGKPAADSTGSYKDREAPSRGATPEDQPTVISRTPVLKSSAKSDRDPDSTAVFNGSGAYQPGSRLGHFEIRDYIGGGGMGCVYRALDVTLSRTVAVKILTNDSVSDKETVRRFLNEARAAARLNHENIAQVYYVGEDGRLPFIAFEYVEGMNIRTMVDNRGPLPLTEAISYTLQVAQALAHAAQRQVIHRDIKPSNVLITPEGQAKVIDMGLARLENPEDSGDDLTRSGVTLGTFDYISPEQAMDPRTADMRSDTYSLGCTLFYMLAARPPFPEGTPLQKLLHHHGDEPPDIRHFRPELPEEVARVLRKMMAKDPRRRYQDSGRLIEALLSLADLVGILPQGPGRAVWVAPKQPTVSLLQRHAPWIVPIAALVCMIVLLDVFWSWPNSPDYPSPPELARNSARTEGGFRSPGQSGSAEDAGSDSGSALAKVGTFDSSSEDVQQATPPGTSQGELQSLPPEPDTFGGTIGEPGPAEIESPGEVSHSNPVKLILARHSSKTALRQDALAAALTSAGPRSLGLLAASDAPPAATNLTAAEGTSGNREEPASTGSASTPATEVLVVDPSNENEDNFASLGDALEAAWPNDVIELWFNGRHEEKPVTLAGRKVTIRAGDGYQPVMVFRPLEIDLVKYPRDMFNVAGAELTLGGVALELDVPRGVPADSWSMFKVGAGGKIVLKGCSLTIRNASDQQTARHPEVAFFRLVPSAELDMGVADGVAENEAHPRARIELQDSLARGEAVFLRAEAPLPIDLIWRNGLLVTTERFLVADAGESAPTPGEAMQISLEHLTAVVRSGLCRLVHSEFTPRQLDASFNCSACVFLARNAPVIEQVGVLDFELSRGQIEWTADQTHYQGFTCLQVRRPFDPLIKPEELPLDSSEEVTWQSLPEAGRPVHSTTPNDYSLDDTAVNDLAQGAGFIAADLPDLPTEPSQSDTEELSGSSTARESSSRSALFSDSTLDR